MKVQVDIEPSELLNHFTAQDIVDDYKDHRDVDDLLEEIGLDACVRYIGNKNSLEMILDGFAEIREVEVYIASLQEWASEQKKKVGG